jgi:hypothetical protein
LGLSDLECTLLQLIKGGALHAHGNIFANTGDYVV